MMRASVLMGFGTQGKLAPLAKMLCGPQVGICVLTGTHLRKFGVARFRMGRYHVVSESCRSAPVGEPFGGGVLILVHVNFSSGRALAAGGSGHRAIEHCSVRFYSADDPDTVMRIFGAYIPPSVANYLNMERLLGLSTPVENASTKDVLPLLLAGDFNTTGWEPLFSEWTQGAGALELLGPDAPTFGMGSSFG